MLARTIRTIVKDWFGVNYDALGLGESGEMR